VVAKTETTLLPFNHSRCPKCWGMTNAENVVRWHRANECAKTTPEHLHRWCGECNFNWMTQTHDDAASDSAE
jgi:hypothetical protein